MNGGKNMENIQLENGNVYMAIYKILLKLETDYNVRFSNHEEISLIQDMKKILLDESIGMEEYNEYC